MTERIKITPEELRANLASPGKPRPGSEWTHHEGGVYGIIALAYDKATGDVLVVYESSVDLVPWVTPLGEFLGHTPSGAKRFVESRDGVAEAAR